MPDEFKRRFNIKEYRCCSFVVVNVYAELVYKINQLSGGRMFITKTC